MLLPIPASVVRRAAAASLLLGTVACGRDEITAPTEPVSGTVTVNASTGWAYLSLDEGTVVTPADPLASTEWDMAFNASSVMLNGGQAGPGGVTGYCLCQNASANPTTEQILAMTAAGELADFEAVTSASAPAASAFVADALTPALTGWHTGTGATAAAANTAFLVRLRDETSFAKVRVTDIEGATAATPGRVTLEFATQPSATGALGTVRTLEVTVPATGTVRVDLAGGAVTTSATDWDLRFDGWTVRVNGGASGPGKAGVATTTTAFDAITDAFAGDARAYRTDTYAGVFGQHPWHRYNLLGDHKISPVFDVYLVRRGSTLYKVQVLDYYGPAGETRRITLRYEQLAD